jgi:hypothetical protein
MDLGCSLGKLLNHALLDFRGLRDNIVVNWLRRGEVELVRGFDIRRLLKEIHQFRQIVKFSKACPRPVAGAFGDGFVKIKFLIFENKSAGRKICVRNSLSSH